MNPDDTDPLGVWQAWVEAGMSDRERHARFDLVPVHLKQAVARHMRTVKAIESFHQNKGNGALRPRG
jgi:hypothetical protein